MADAAYTLFDTPLGRCGMAWNDAGVLGVQLPEARESATRERLLRRAAAAQPGEPPPQARRAIDGIVALFSGRAGLFDTVPLDMRLLPPFHRRVYEAARQIGPGQTLSYGTLAAQIGAPGAARAVGQALGRNPFPVIVPCHRVLAAGGKTGGFSAAGGVVTKMRLLSLESALSGGTGSLFGEHAPALPFDVDAAVAHLHERDRALAHLIDAVGPCRLRLDATPSVFTALAQSIVYQQLTTRAAGTIFARVRALYPHGHLGPTAEQVLRTPDAKLQAAGVSTPKLLALKGLARKAARHEIPTLNDVEAMDDDAIVEALSRVRGIGPWTVQMFLIFHLGRPDVLPLEDYALRKAYALHIRRGALPETAEFARRGERWRPYRSVASWYLWRSLER
jgi:methylated-DNA-[protein]-cysteine S-methyltransferase